METELVRRASNTDVFSVETRQHRDSTFSIDRFFPLIKIYKSSSPHEKVSRRKIHVVDPRFSWQNGKIKFKERKEGTNDNHKKFASHRRQISL